ncbi:MAG: hypothetical protein GWP05_05220 [Anaerolineaceae bacterium]|nr:hypothetical protein [Anaerolineaceae bacterium]
MTGNGSVMQVGLTGSLLDADRYTVTVAAGTLRYDLDLSGDITSADLRAARIRLGSQLP